MSRIPGIIQALESGHDIILSTYLRHVRVTPRLHASWKRKGLDMFRSDETHDYMRRGNHWDIIDYCKLTIGA